MTITGTNDARSSRRRTSIGAVTEAVTPAGNLTDSGTIAFSDVDLTDVHLVSATGTPIGSVLGTLTAVKNTDTTGTGTGGQLTWTYSVAASAVEYLAAGQTTARELHDHARRPERQRDHPADRRHDHRHQRCADRHGAGPDRRGHRVGHAARRPDRQRAIAFTDVDLNDVHLVSANGTPVGSVLGTLDRGRRTATRPAAAPAAS